MQLFTFHLFFLLKIIVLVVEQIFRVLTLNTRYVFKVATFTPDPIADANDVICVAIFGEHCELAYIRHAKDTGWIRVVEDKQIMIDDVMYYDNWFYALTYDGTLIYFEISYPFKYDIKSETTETTQYNKKRYFCDKGYLTESCGELLQARRYIIKQFGSCDEEIRSLQIQFRKAYMD